MSLVEFAFNESLTGAQCPLPIRYASSRVHISLAQSKKFCLFHCLSLNRSFTGCPSVSSKIPESLSFSLRYSECARKPVSPDVSENLNQVLVSPADSLCSVLVSLPLH
ncbi:hypothetical protein PoB_005935100 [Plakobranchus ocellatus]|uniref:Uncharacterized protein n=1 Tax=Plakobranchus ocellatus TaxID=259542 RepID=A0AAV4CC02_9GAST|nr:hypothetical protein PoB_005935100 [Plakobranchus ocellatus]